ncbi:Alkaline phosphatase synthesis sensor protein phoR [Chryseobacterium taklimakanense]|uniref:histidine kinase n=1 Tax=Chryseobacterium taklimakanense TaxID=536441 RepID=A0A239XK13_9FLAO|nr:HAMP domain-containing sensor histidine kinase [Chryseobacterium taklimakanense]SNV47251.1 Alkaline phosphatase synthesis sensor protein phoR [Chryseobacterium taklimakanense]
MNQRFIPIISILMSISVVIFVTLQIKWLKEYYGALDQDFSNKVSIALDQSVKKIEDIEYNQLINENYKNFGKTVLANNAQPSSTIIQQTEDSASKRTITYQKNIIERENLPISNTGDSLNRIKLWTDENLIKIQRDTTKREALTAALNSSINSGEFSLKEFVRVEGSNRPIEKRVSPQTIDSVVSNALKNNGITSGFGYGIFDKNNKLTTLTNEDYRKQQTNTKYDKVLFRDSKDNPLYTLSLVFPRKDVSLIKNNLPMLLGTFLSLLTILGIYITSINYMMQQKRIADVKTDFINNMSHEFKTPLATISVATDSLANDTIATNPEKVKYYSQLIKQENLRMKKQVENVLNMSKLERNEVQLFLKETNMRQLIRDISQSFQLIVNERNGSLIQEFDADRYIVKVDEFHISNMLVNLLDNANKYSPEAPEIKVKTKNEGHWYVIEISDKGMGMDAINKNKIFEKFFREETGNIHNVKGQGLGLSYVKKIIELHKGQIHVESVKGKGSTFTIKLPMS